MWWTADDQLFAKYYNVLKYSIVADIIANLPLSTETHSPLKDLENSSSYFENEKYRASVGYLLQAIRKLYNYVAGGGMQLIDRGDPVAWDFTLSNLITDGAWHDLDLSAIVPDGTRAVLLKISLLSDDTTKYIFFRKKGNMNDINSDPVRTQSPNVYINACPVVFLDVNKKIEYQTVNTIFSQIYISVRGWFS